MPANLDSVHELLLSPVLHPGDRVRLVSPASFPSREWLAESIGILQSWGLTVEVGDHALDQWGYMAGHDQDRLDDLNDAFRDPGVRAIITVVGGAGAYRIADGIDFDAVRTDPKPLLGFSDITNLHLALWQHCGLATIHGCLAGARAQASVRRLLMSTEPLTLHRDPDALSAAVGVLGHAAGPLIGGNLSAVDGFIGAGLPSLDGAVLFLEDFRTIGLGRVDRQLTHLIRSGSLEGVRGIALGLFTGFDDYTDRGWNVLDVLRDRLGQLGVPVLGGLEVGHGGVGVDGGPDQYAATLGPTAVLDTDAGTLTIGPCVR
jgi:muramoyltetrapeptide carboxypeptidase